MSPRLLITLALASAIFVAGCGSDGDAKATTSTGTTATTPTTASMATTDTTVTSPPPTSATSTDCSAGATAIRAADETGLPAPVAKTRRAILTAAAACDYPALQKLIDPKQFAFQVGAGASDQTATDYWKSVDAKERVIARMAELLSTPGAVLTEGTIKTYVWPAVHAGKRTDADWQALIESGAYTEQEVGAMRKDDLYFGYRVGIRPDGTWSYFTAGD